jgi:adenine-specific DNA-methyltransferase
MNYIGSKKSLLEFIERVVGEIAGPGPHTVCDIFAGTGAVGAHFKQLGHRVIANDLQYYAYVLARHYIGNSKELAFSELDAALPELALASAPCSERPRLVLQYLQTLPGVDGFMFNNYCVGGTVGSEHVRQYFSDANARKCDAVRAQLETWRLTRVLNDDEFYCCLAALLEAIDKVANTASVYGAFLKQLKRSAAADLTLKPLPLLLSAHKNLVLNADANTVIREVEGTVLYLDPPYNHRQYAANYHILETIARDDSPALHGKTGLRDYSEQKSRYSARNDVKAAFHDLIAHAKFDYIFLSYNDEGLLTPEDVAEIMRERGNYGFRTQEYARFRADVDSATRNYVSDRTVEYLHFVSTR